MTPNRKKRKSAREGKAMLWTIVGIIAAIVVVLAIIISTRPDTFRYERSTVINATPAQVFPHINNYKNWKWNPFANADPEIKITYSGPEEGEGAVYAWTGNSNVGEGKMTIIASKPAEVVRLRLEFLRPMPAVNTAEFLLAPEGEGTRVTWAMYGDNTIMGKCMGLVMNMDEMVGTQFEKGLADMKAQVESAK